MTFIAVALIALGAMAQPQQRELSAADKIAEDLQNAFFAGMGDVMDKLQELNDAFYRSGNRDSVQRLMEPYQKIYMERQKAYLEKYPTTALAAQFMRMELGRMPLEKMKEVYNKFDATAKETTAGKAMAKEIATLEQVAPGNPAPEIAKNDFVTGKPFSLSSLKGKVVLLDFWASWCGWCIKGFPEMKQFYKKYAGKFEILGVDCNDTEEKWRKAVSDEQLPWLHVYNPRDSKVLSLYGVQGFPTKIIISPDGKIVKTIVGEDPAFYTLLDELFAK